jgi:hypothetical protein
LRGDNFIEGFWDCSGWLSMIIWGVPPGLAAAASRFEHQGQLQKPEYRLHACSSVLRKEEMNDDWVHSRWVVCHVSGESVLITDPGWRLRAVGP